MREQYNSSLLSEQLRRYISAYQLESSEKWKEDVYEFILLQTDPFKITDKDKENLKEHIIQLESSLKGTQEKINKEDTKSFVYKWINNLINL